eukprot:EG_transcript_42083
MIGNHHLRWAKPASGPTDPTAGSSSLKRSLKDALPLQLHRCSKFIPPGGRSAFFQHQIRLFLCHDPTPLILLRQDGGSACQRCEHRTMRRMAGRGAPLQMVRAAAPAHSGLYEGVVRHTRRRVEGLSPAEN